MNNTGEVHSARDRPAKGPTGQRRAERCTPVAADISENVCVEHYQSPVESSSFY